MEMKREAVRPPYTLEVARDDDGRLVEIVIRAADGGELDHRMLQDANRDLAEQFRREATRGSSKPGSAAATDAIRRARREFSRSNGEITPEYLAALAVAYDEVSKQPGPGIIEPIAEALDRSGSAVKQHVARARQDGFLESTTRGRYGGTATTLARRIYEADEIPDLG